MADLRLPDGSRVNATLPPATIDGPDDLDPPVRSAGDSDATIC
jgi:hypothetical protein